MKRIDALSVANYFIKIANEAKVDIRPLGLMKRVYIAHGFSLAINNQSLLDPRFDEVEAWRYGPVIPSVYHSFKHLRNTPITTNDYAPRIQIDDQGDVSFSEPMLEDTKAEKIVQMVWQRYLKCSDIELVCLTHQDGTPWKRLYKEGQNIPIPDDYTKLYYEAIVNSVKQQMKK